MTQWEWVTRERSLERLGGGERALVLPFPPTPLMGMN